MDRSFDIAAREPHRMPDFSLPDDWHVEQVRLTCFANMGIEDLGPRAGALFSEVLGAPPENESLQRSGPAPLFTGESPHGDGYVSLRAQPNRYDWLLSAGPQLGAPTPTLTLGKFASGMKAIERLIRDGALQPEVRAQRIAFGAILLVPVESRERGYAFLDDLLPAVAVDPEGSRDFLYRINRRRRSEHADVEINRLSEWSVAQVTEQTVSLGPTPTVHGAGVTFMGRVRLDVNTAPEYAGAFSGDAKIGVATELLRIGEELATKGDVP